MKASFVAFCCAMALCLQCSQARSRDCIEYSTKQHRPARVGIIPQVRIALLRMFHHRRGASFIPYARVFQFCSIMWCMTRFWRQLAHNITIHILRLSLKKTCCEINVEKIRSFAGCHLATHPKSRSSRSRRICLQVILLFVLEPS